MADMPMKFQLAQIHETLLREASRRLDLYMLIIEYADLSAKHAEVGNLQDDLGAKLAKIEEALGLLVQASRDCGALVGSAT